MIIILLIAFFLSTLSALFEYKSSNSISLKQKLITGTIGIVFLLFTSSAVLMAEKMREEKESIVDDIKIAYRQNEMPFVSVFKKVSEYNQKAECFYYIIFFSINHDASSLYINPAQYSK